VVRAGTVAGYSGVVVVTIENGDLDMGLLKEFVLGSFWT
jgi:hypothetical protein